MTLICSRCSAIGMMFAAVGDRCFNKKCPGQFVDSEATARVSEPAQELAPVADASSGQPDEEPNSNPTEAPEVVAEPVEQGEVEEPVGSMAPAFEGRVAAVKMAKEIIASGKPASPGQVLVLRSLFKDLGSIHRPARGFIDMADAREKHKGQFFSNPDVGELLWELICPPPNIQVLEANIGCANLIARPDQCFVTGIDVDKDSVMVSRAILGPKHCVIRDEMQHHQFKEKFDLVLGNPPYSVSVRDRARLWGRSVGWDGWGKAEVVWMEQAALAVKKGGVVAAVLPVGIYEMFSPPFVRWLNTRLNLVAEVVLPKNEAFVYSKWPASLYIWVNHDWTLPTKTLECKSVQEWIDEVRKFATGRSDTRGWKRDLFEIWGEFHGRWHDIWRVITRMNDGAVKVKPWVAPKKSLRTIAPPYTEHDGVLIRVANGKLKVIPNGMGALAKLTLIRFELGHRYDHKQEKSFYKWDEVVNGPAIAGVEKVNAVCAKYGLPVEIEAASAVWLGRRRRWLARQKSDIPRWVVSKDKAA